MRTIPLAPDAPALAQAELALEGHAPFPLAQLFWGCWVAPDRSRALVYAAHRRRFTPEETAAWEQADLVVPDSLPVLAEAPDEETRRRLAADPARPVGTPRARRKGDQLFFEIAGATGAATASAVSPRTDLDALDVRDRAFQQQRRRDRRQRELAWRLLLVAGSIVAAAVVLEVAGLTFSLLARAQRLRVTAQAAGVQKLETAQTLASRVDDLTHRRLRFFEMLATVNAARPRSIQFTRSGSIGRNTIEIEAQTASSDDVDAFQAALRKLADLEKADVRDLRARDGVTTFTLSVVFKAAPTAGNGGGT